MKDGLERRMAEELCKVADERFNYMYALKCVLLDAGISPQEVVTMIETAKKTASIRSKP